MRTPEESMKELAQGLRGLGLGTCDGTPAGAITDLGMVRLLMRNGITYAEGCLKEVAEKDWEDRAFLNGMIDAHLDVKSAIDETLVQILKPAFSKPEAIEKLFARKLRENTYANQFAIAARCFAIIKRKMIPFRELSLERRQSLKVALTLGMAGRPTREELCGEGFDREIAALADSDPVQTVLHTVGAQAAAREFLALHLGVPASTGRRLTRRYRDRKRVS